MNLRTLGPLISGVITGVGGEFYNIRPQAVRDQTMQSLNCHTLPSPCVRR
ncbi:hypothetical protein HMPREF0185_00250 [Brevundimonas diminuta 470-4]|nr:hypothetical protein HMPREF0185_00250 [Brevundimonas diminuta 470-4]